MTRRVAALAVAMLVVSPVAVVAKGSRPHAPGKRVFVVGDSLAVGTRPYLGRALGGWRVRTSASISKQAPQGAAELVRRHLPPVVVASLGTNGDPRAVSSFEGAVRRALRAVGKPGCLVWPNIVRPAVAGASYAGYNRVLSPAELEPGQPPDGRLGRDGGAQPELVRIGRRPIRTRPVHLLRDASTTTYC